MLRDKELIIDGRTLNSPEQQVWQNMEDIKKLMSYIKPIYQTTATLTESSTGVLVEDTNVPENSKVGWILTEDGLFFEIEDNNGISLLLKFLANFKGETGESGATPVITANATVDANVGTPGVTVTKTGTDANPVFNFSFTNLKGETGTSLIEVEVVSSLPATGRPGVLYFVPNGGSVPNQYDEYIYSEDWEKIGTQNIDLSNYIQKSNTSGLVKNDGTIDTTVYAKISDITPVLLWTNPSPSVAFVPDATVEGNSVKTVVLSQDISNFNYIVIGYKKYKNADQSINYVKLKLTLQNEIYLDATNTSQYEKIIVTRSAFTDYTDGTKIHFRAGYRDQVADNDRAIPVYIYGTNIL